MVKLFIVRHGETELNGRGIIQCQVDTYSINENGKTDAHYVGQNLPKDIEIIISSPLKRAVATASIISTYNNAPIMLVDGLEEMYGGNINTMTISEFGAMKFNPPLIYKGYVSGKDFVVGEGQTIRDCMFLNDLEYQNFSYPDGESKAQAKARFEKAILDFVKKYPQYEKIIVVSHGFTIKSFVAGIPELSDFKMMRHREILEFNLENNKFIFENYKKFER
ncbi:histidine phosphatase family protein [bacterium]|nr:histidine phosphatase family protein [bacterium]